METDNTQLDSHISDDELYEVYPTFSSPMSDASSSTPYKPRLSNIPRDKSSVDQLKSGLEGDLEGRTLAQLELCDFVQHFMKCEKAILDRITGLEWALDASEVANIEKAIAVGTEAHLHDPFMEITQSLLQKVIAVIGAPQTLKDRASFSIPDENKPHIVQVDGKDVDLSRIFYDTKGSTKYRYYGTHVKPDFLRHRPLAVDEDHNLSQNTPMGMRMLTQATRVGEFKKKNAREGPRFKKAKTATVGSLASVDESKELGITTPTPAVTQDPFSSQSTSIGKGTLCSSPIASSLHSVDPSFASPSFGSSASKRKIGDLQDEVAAEERAAEMLLAEVATTTEVSEDHRQLGVYAMASLSAAARLYTTGIFVDGFQVTMFYYGRRLVARSLSFDFSQHPQYLALLVYAMLASDYRNDGLNIHLHRKACKDFKCGGCVGSNMKDACFRFPLDENAMVQEVEGGPPRKFKAPTDSTQLFATFDVAAIIQEAIGIVGRATVVYNVEIQDVPGREKSPKVKEGAALKLSWQPWYRCVEMEIIAHLLAKAPSCKDHLPEIVYGGVFSAESLGLPSASNSIPTDKLPNFVARALHVVVSKLYHQIWKVSSVHEFVKIWLDCVKCEPPCSLGGGKGSASRSQRQQPHVSFDGKQATVREVNGILNDWDMASKLGEDGHPEVTTATHRTGTIPFMSPDLLDVNPSRHYYRHDLESFVWILLYATVRYNIPKRRKEALPESVKDWDGPTMNAALGVKYTLLGPQGAYRLQADARPEWKDILDTLGLALLDLIESAHHSKWGAGRRGRRPAKNPVPQYDYATCDGILTYETFMDTVTSNFPTPA